MTFNPGYVTALCSAVCNGCFAVIFKHYRHQVHPVVFTCFFTIGFLALFLLSIAFLAFNPLATDHHFNSVAPQFCPHGILSGMTIPGTFNLEFYGVRTASVGLAMTQGIISASNSLVSFTVGVFLFQNPVKSAAMAVSGLGLLLLGMAGIVAAKSDWLSPRRSGNAESSALADKLSLESAAAYGATDDEVQTGDSVGKDVECMCTPAGKEVFSQSKLFGVGCAVGAGVVGGLTLSGLQGAPPECQGIVFLPSVGIGAFGTQIVWMCLHYWCCLHDVDSPGFKSGCEGSRVGFVERVRYNFQHGHYMPGIAAGLIYATGLAFNLVSVYYIGLELAGPFFQFNVILEGCWGIFLYGEIKSWQGTTLFFSSALVLLAAALLLSESTT